MSAPLRPLSSIVPDTRSFWEACRRHESRLQQCRDCQVFRFYPGPACASCGSSENGWQRVSGRGEVYSVVMVRRAIHLAFEGDAPFAVALIEIEGTGGIRLPVRVVDYPPGKVQIGMTVEVSFEALNDEVTLPVFRPLAVAKVD